MDCTGESKELIASTGFRLVIGLQAMASFFGAIIGAVVIKKCSNLYFHVNCKILIITMLVFCVIHSVLIATMQTIHLYRFILHTNPCEIPIQSAVCFGVRFPTVVCMALFALLQTAMVIERSLALWKRKEYDHYGCNIGFAISAICVILSLILTSWSMGKAELSTVTVYCSGITTETAERITIMCFLLCSIDIISLVGMAMLHFFNVAAMKSKFSDLQSSYQLHENDTVFRLLIPLVVFNGICHLAFSISSGLFLIFRAHFSYITYRTTSAATYTVPFFTLVSPCLLWFIIRKSKRTRAEKLKMLGRQIGNERDMYFKAYSKMWNQ